MSVFAGGWIPVVLNGTPETGDGMSVSGVSFDADPELLAYYNAGNITYTWLLKGTQVVGSNSYISIQDDWVNQGLSVTVSTTDGTWSGTSGVVYISEKTHFCNFNSGIWGE